VIVNNPYNEPRPKRREPWWIWHWDYREMGQFDMPYMSMRRWRRGSLLTIYRWESASSVKWWFYGPFNLAIGFAYEKY
jgi:hypothetical protein